MATNISLFVSGSVLYVSGTVSAGAQMVVNVPLTVQSITSSVVVVSSSIVFQSGSTKWGDTNDDVHSFTGSIRVNGGISGTLTGTVFGSINGTEGLTGSLQRLISGQSYLASGPHISITTASNGQVLIAGEGVADVSSSYIVVGTTGSLPNERQLSASNGLTLTDNGAGSTVALGINDNVVATISGSRFTGNVVATTGLSGSLQQTAAGLSYLVGGFSTSITSQSNGQVNVSHQYRTATVTSDVTASNGLTLVDATLGTVNVCLPDATLQQGRPMHIKKIDPSANFVNVGTINDATQLIDGTTVQSFNAQWTALSVIASGSNWYIV